MANARAIIFDTDIGTNPDDFFALLLLLNVAPDELKLIVTGNHYPVERAQFVSRVLKEARREDIELYAGEETGCVEFYAKQYIDGGGNISSDYLSAMKKICESYTRVLYVTVQGCSNVARFLQTHLECRDVLEIYHMGLTTKGAAENYISGGTNMEADPMAAKWVYEAGMRLKVVGSHTTINDALRVHPETSLYKKIQASGDKNHQLLFSHLNEYHTRRNIWPALHDPLTTAVALGESFVQFEDLTVTFNNEGKYRLTPKGTCVLVSKSESRTEEFMKYVTEKI